MGQTWLDLDRSVAYPVKGGKVVVESNSAVTGEWELKGKDEAQMHDSIPSHIARVFSLAPT